MSTGDSGALAPVLASAHALVARLKKINALAKSSTASVRELLAAPLDLDSADIAYLQSSPPEKSAAAALTARQHGASILTDIQAQIGRLRAQFQRELRRAADAPEEVLNEEGLPFVDPTEQLPASPPETPRLESLTPSGTNTLGRTPGVVAPFVPQAPQGDRAQWMESVFSALEVEEAAEAATEAAQAAQTTRSQGEHGPPVPANETRAAGRADDASSTRAAEPFRRGFLNQGASRKEAVAARGGADPEDDGVAEEAARIVELLGPEVIRGHPNADRILADIAAQPRVEYKPVPPKPEDTAAEPEAPAVGDAVVERSGDAAMTATRRSRKLSAFKRRAQGEVPAGPTVSHGVSAIERAARADEERVSERSQPLPHARPSKAYAERLAQRNVARDDEEEVRPGKRVHFGRVTEHGDGDDEADEDVDMDGTDADENDDSSDAAMWDSDDDYDADDIEALRPSMDGHEGDAYWNDDLARAYAEAKSRLFAQPPAQADEEGAAAEDYGVRAG